MNFIDFISSVVAIMETSCAVQYPLVVQSNNWVEVWRFKGAVKK